MNSTTGISRTSLFQKLCDELERLTKDTCFYEIFKKYLSSDSKDHLTRVNLLLSFLDGIVDPKLNDLKNRCGSALFEYNLSYQAQQAGLEKERLRSIARDMTGKGTYQESCATNAPTFDELKGILEAAYAGQADYQGKYISKHLSRWQLFSDVTPTDRILIAFIFTMLRVQLKTPPSLVGKAAALKQFAKHLGCSDPSISVLAPVSTRDKIDREYLRKLGVFKYIEKSQALMNAVYSSELKILQVALIDVQHKIPDCFRCPISQVIMQKPMTTVVGTVYEEDSIKGHYSTCREGGKRLFDPLRVGPEVIADSRLSPNIAIKRGIGFYKKALHRRAPQYFKLNEFKLAENYFEQLMECSPEKSLFVYSWLRCIMSQGDYARVISEYEKLSGDFQEEVLISTCATTCRGLLAQFAQDWVGAIIHYQKVTTCGVLEKTGKKALLKLASDNLALCESELMRIEEELSIGFDFPPPDMENSIRCTEREKPNVR